MFEFDWKFFNCELFFKIPVFKPCKENKRFLTIEYLYYFSSRLIITPAQLTIELLQDGFHIYQEWDDIQWKAFINIDVIFYLDTFLLAIFNLTNISLIQEICSCFSCISLCCKFTLFRLVKKLLLRVTLASFISSSKI